MKKFEGHTQGPWHWTKDEQPGAYVGLFDAMSTPIFFSFTNGLYCIDETNARLIADAPELLRQRDEAIEAIKSLVSWLEQPGKTNKPRTSRIPRRLFEQLSAIAECEKEDE